MSRYWLSLTLAFVMSPALLAQDKPADGFERERRPGDTTKDGLEGKAPPALKVEKWISTDGKELKLADLKGKVVVLDFWGTWCGPCRAAMPHLKELYARHKADGLEVIGVHTTNGAEELPKFLEESPLPWPIAVDVEKGTTSVFLVDSYPDYYVIDRAGNLRFADLANAELDRAVETLLKEKP